MRIVAGKYRGRLLSAPFGKNTRPTSDRVRQAIFNILNSRFLKENRNWTDLSVLDAFAGTGALGIEAVSHGASRLFVAENEKEALACLRQNLKLLEKDDCIVQIFSDALRLPVCEKPVDLLFMDPPYRQGLVMAGLLALKEKGWVDSHTVCVIEADKAEENILPLKSVMIDTRVYGKAKIMLVQIAD